ncbi:MAG TPA: MlaD family protein, partial [Myxococcaceae bacterium]|nr:MlaD family protein [Myxococcaceae bacterium]
FAKKGGLSRSEATTAFAYFNDASGLTKKSRVQIAGIPVGELIATELVPVQDPKTGLTIAKAKITLRILRDVGLRTDASLTKRSESLLGDYMLDLFPGSEKADPLPEGGEIKRVYDQGGMEAIFNTLTTITGDIQAVTESLRKVLGGDKGTGSLERIVENLVKLSDAVETTVRASSEKLDAILANFAEFSKDVRTLSQGQEETIARIVQNIDAITRDVRDVLTTVKKIVGSGEGDLKESVASLKELLNRLNHSLTNVEEVTTNVKEGKGALGTLLNDERLGQKLSETVEDVSDFASKLTRLQIEVGVKSEYLFAQQAAKNTLSLKLAPRPDKYYLIELTDDPRGFTTQQTIQTNPPSVGNPPVQTQYVTTQTLKYSAQFAKRFYFTTLRFGIIESTGGVGMDLHSPWPEVWRDMISLKFDAFNFSVNYLRYPRMRAAVRVQLFEHIALSGGVDDALNAPIRDATTHQLLAGRDFFFGAGIFFTDDDIKSILTVAPKP